MRGRSTVGAAVGAAGAVILAVLLLRRCGSPSADSPPPPRESTPSRADAPPARRGRAADAVESTSKASTDPAATADGNVRGVVVEEGTDTPIAGATVRLITPKSIPGGAPSTTTAADGRFDLRGVPAGEAVLLVERDGWRQTGLDGLRSMDSAFGERRDDAAPSADSGYGARIHVASAASVVERSIDMVKAAVLWGRVVVGEDQPVEGAEVTADARDDGATDDDPLAAGAIARVRTDADGAFQIPSPVSRGIVELSATAPGMYSGAGDTVQVTDDSPPPAVLRLEPGGRIEGRVLDEQGKPLAGVEMSLFCDMTDASGTREILPDIEFWRRFHAATRTDGTFAFDAAPEGTIIVFARHATHVRAHQAGVHVVAGASTNVDLRMARGLSISGRVVRDDGKPLGRARVLIEPSGEDVAPLSFEDSRQTPDADGLFRVDCLLAAKYGLAVEDFGAGDCEPVVVEAGARDVVLRIRTGLSSAGDAK